MTLLMLLAVERFAMGGGGRHDGRLGLTECPSNQSRGLVRDELFWPRMGLLRVSWDGTRKDSIGWFTGGGQFFFDVGGRPVGDIQPFTWDVSVAYSTNHIFVTSSDRYEIEAFGYDGTLERIIRRMVDPIPVTEGDREKLRTRILEFADRQNRRADYERWLARVPFSENKPAIESIVTDELNNLWVRPTQPAERNSDIWTVFGPDGSMLGDVAFPKDLCVRRCGQFYGSSIEIGDDYLLATMMDEFDVERVQLYNLIKPGS